MFSSSSSMQEEDDGMALDRWMLNKLRRIIRARGRRGKTTTTRTFEGKQHSNPN